MSKNAKKISTVTTVTKKTNSPKGNQRVAKSSRVPKGQRVATATSNKQNQKQTVTTVTTTRRKRNKRPKKLQHEMMNHYLAALVDPEHYPAMGVPDSIEVNTNKMHIIINQTLPFLESTYNENTPAGTFMSWVQPDIINPVAYLGEITQANPTSYLMQITGECLENDGVYGLYDVAGSEDANDRKQLILSQLHRNVILPVIYADSPDSAYPMFVGYNASYGTFYGVPGLSNTTNSTYGLQLDVMFAQNLSSGDTLNYNIVSQYGLLQSGNVVSSGGGSNITLGPFALGSAALMDTGLPGIGVQLWMSGSSTTLNWVVRSIEFSGYIGYSVSGFPAGGTVRMMPLTFPDETTISTLINKYRVSALSCKTSYMGSDLNNGGLITSFYYQGGSSPGYEGFFTIAEVSNREFAFFGPVKTGSYTWWSPGDIKDQKNFKNISSPVSQWDDPYIVTVGNTATPTQFNSIRIIVHMHIENITASQILEKEPSRVAPLELLQAAEEIKKICHSMENPNHAEEVFEFLKQVGSTVLNGTKWALQNADTILPFISMLV